MPRDKRPLSDEEKQLWQYVKRSVEPLSAQPKAEPAPDIVVPRVRKSLSKPAPLPMPPAPSAPLTQGDYAGVDRRTAERFRKGDYGIDATLDLHGHSRDKAHQSLIRFVQAHYREGSRCLLIITGKGARDKPGILRESLPVWLADEGLRPMVLAFDVAKQHHGGGGAYYVLLKRKRDAGR